MDLTCDEGLAYEAVREIQEIKRDNRQRPDYALLFEVYNYLRPELAEGFEGKILQALRCLYRKGLIVFHKNVNGVPMFGIINQNTKEI